MQVLCKSTKGEAEIRCAVCGQGFIAFWERQSRAERAEALKEIQLVLRAQHSKLAGPQAHPQAGFLVPEWDGRMTYSGAAMLGNAPPTWSL
jgi:hypothetical protein